MTISKPPTSIDSQPERRKALEFANRFYGRVRLCHYDSNLDARETTDKETDLIINVNRTAWLDMSLVRLRTKRIDLPLNIPLEYRQHMMNIVRVFEKDATGNPIARYVKPDHLADHYAHARNYAEIALPLAGGIGGVQVVKSIY
jgi:hypothetical protein